MSSESVCQVACSWVDVGGFCTRLVVRLMIFTASVRNIVDTPSYACNETNWIHYLSSVYSVTIPLHVLGLLIAHHQEVTMYICNKWYVLYVLLHCQLTVNYNVQHVPIVAYIHCYP
jgi:hypothetical protein